MEANGTKGQGGTKITEVVLRILGIRKKNSKAPVALGLSLVCILIGKAGLSLGLCPYS